jgi:hypothetical protein
MREVLIRLVDVPIARILVLAGFVFILIGILGKIEGKIEPGPTGRLSAAILGVMLLAVGIFMQYTELKYAEMHEMNVKAQMEQAALLLAQSAPASAVPAVASFPIKVVSASYGRNCNAKAGNATETVADTCDGRSSCDFPVDPAELGDPAPNCSKDFAAEWKCGDGNAVYSAALSSLAGKNDKLRLSCAGE